MKLCMQVGLGPDHNVLGGDPAPLPQRGRALLQFSAHICCGQLAGWIKMHLGMEVGLVPGDFVSDVDPCSSPLPKRGGASPIFGPCLLWPNGWMDQDATWYRRRPRPRQHCVRWGLSSPPKKGAEPPPQFSAHVHCGQTAGWTKVALGTEVGQHCARWGPNSPPEKWGCSPLPDFQPISIVAKRLDASRCHLVWR